MWDGWSSRQTVSAHRSAQMTADWPQRYWQRSIGATWCGSAGAARSWTSRRGRRVYSATATSHRRWSTSERSDYSGYYLEFANRVLWPVFHYRVNLAEYGREQWATYGRVNEMLAERLASILQPDDLVWVHDYHMIPMGAALRRLGVDNPLGFFLHIPFPAPEVLTTLPVHEALARSLFAYDLVGFQTGNELAGIPGLCRAGSRRAGGRRRDDPGLRDQRPRGTISDQHRSSGGRCPSSARGQHSPGNAVARQSLRTAAYHRCSTDSTTQVGLVHRLDAVERLLEIRPQHRRGIVMLRDRAAVTRGCT